MAKKKTETAPEPKEIKMNRISNFTKSETTHFVIGLICVIFSVYLLLAFTSFFFTGGADQNVIDQTEVANLTTHIKKYEGIEGIKDAEVVIAKIIHPEEIKNYAGARGAQISEYLINDCFGVASYFIVLFLAVLGMRLMRAYQFRIWKWFMSCTIMMVWLSIALGFVFDGTFTESFVYPGGLH